MLARRTPSSAHDPRPPHSRALLRPMSATEQLTLEVARRRTFAIISHPDAGKTTLTEKLLLYGGVLHLSLIHI